MAGTIYRGFILLFVLINAVYTERIKDMIYMPLEGVSACFRRHNGTHQFGCSSSRSGSVGVIQMVDTDVDLKWLEKSGDAGPYTAVVPFSMFTNDTLSRLRNTNNINGVLLARNTSVERPSHYSPDDTCPNRYSGVKECDKPWNPQGSSLLVQDWPFPMFYLKNETLLQEVRSCYEKFNAHDRETQSERSLCAIEMRAYMYAAVDSETCMRRSVPRINFNPPTYCDPLGDRNIYWPVAPLENNTESVIMVIARLDASSMFEDLSPGAGSAVTGFVTLIATAYYLNKMNPTVDKTNVVFALLNGEAFDYIGSSRLVYDLELGRFDSLGGKKLTLDQIQTVIELGQVGDGDVYLHSSNSDSDPLINGLKESLSAQILKDSLPPASIHRFLTANPNISATVIANHRTEFTNRFYNGILDDEKSLDPVGNQTKIVTSLNKIAFNLASQLFIRATGKNPTFSNDSAAANHIKSMLSCYLKSADCDLFKAASPPSFTPEDRIEPLYVGVNRSASVATSLTGHVLMLLTGNKVDFNQTICRDNHLIWVNGFDSLGTCIKTTVNMSFVTSPAFMMDGYNMTSRKYSTWTESVWQGLGMRMFLKPSAATERRSMIVGSIIGLLSFVVVWFIQSRANLLFDPIGTADC